MSFLKINGVDMPTPDESGVSIGKELLWSENTGRIITTGLFVGDIISEKTTVKFTFTGLTSEEVEKIERQLTAFYTLEFTDPVDTSKTIKLECYKTPRTYVLKHIQNGNAKFGKFTLSCIER